MTGQDYNILEECAAYFEGHTMLTPDEESLLERIRTALATAGGIPAESRYGRVCEGCTVPQDKCPHKPEPLAQYLAEYIRQELDDRIDYSEWPKAMVRALDAYQSTEQVTVKIERVTE